VRTDNSLQSSIALLNQAAQDLLPEGWKYSSPPALATLAWWGLNEGLGGVNEEHFLTQILNFPPERQADLIATSGVDEGLAFGPEELMKAGPEGAAEIVMDAIKSGLAAG
jgi:hypothetical protein